MIQTCPTDIIRATPDRIWELLTVPRELAHWSGMKIIEAPARPLTAPLRAGDRLVLGPPLGAKLRLTFQVVAAMPPLELRVEVRLPLGITNHEVTRITALGSGECRVTYN